MNAEEIQSRLSKYLDRMEDLVAQGVELGKEEIPEFLHELLNWIFWDNLSYSLICATTLAILLWLCKFTYLSYKRNEVEINFIVNVPSLVVTIMLFLTLTIETISSAKKCVKVCVAPRLVIVEELRNLTK